MRPEESTRPADETASSPPDDVEKLVDMFREWITRSSDGKVLRALSFALPAWLQEEEVRWIVGTKSGDPFARPVGKRVAANLQSDIATEFTADAAIDLFGIWIQRADKATLRAVWYALVGLTLVPQSRCELGSWSDGGIYARVLEQPEPSRSSKQARTEEAPRKNSAASRPPAAANQVDPKARERRTAARQSLKRQMRSYALMTETPFEELVTAFAHQTDVDIDRASEDELLAYAALLHRQMQQQSSE